eukprot:4697165-Ditylum_brightwellii.AAC.1
MQNVIVDVFDNPTLVMFNQQAQCIEQLLQQHMKMQYKRIHFPGPLTAVPNPTMLPFHSPISQAPNATAQDPLQNHAISPSQHTPIRPPHLE